MVTFQGRTQKFWKVSSTYGNLQGRGPCPYILYKIYRGGLVSLTDQEWDSLGLLVLYMHGGYRGGLVGLTDQV